ncbi:hypothetical protein BD626DRAFT_635452 [Schizophyllum amplum]|uniref:Uncharacterized protein n=1 Tax=Schizophyllum amplum TaxID=97359 RepID=A0A550BW49_9AGAR|nr:hypothetical protein BD626DRAFT_635452 [Auriculariopsis ampla]
MAAREESDRRVGPSPAPPRDPSSRLVFDLCRRCLGVVHVAAASTTAHSLYFDPCGPYFRLGRAPSHALFRSFFDHLALGFTCSRLSMDDTDLKAPLKGIRITPCTPAANRAASSTPRQAAQVDANAQVNRRSRSRDLAARLVKSKVLVSDSRAIYVLRLPRVRGASAVRVNMHRAVGVNTHRVLVAPDALALPAVPSAAPFRVLTALGIHGAADGPASENKTPAVPRAGKIPAQDASGDRPHDSRIATLTVDVEVVYSEPVLHHTQAPIRPRPPTPSRPRRLAHDLANDVTHAHKLAATSSTPSSPRLRPPPHPRTFPDLATSPTSPISPFIRSKRRAFPASFQGRNKCKMKSNRQISAREF